MSAGLALTEWTLAERASAQLQAATQPGSIPRRKFGRHPDQVSALGLGGRTSNSPSISHIDIGGSSPFKTQ